jgi:hypothetical protein
VQFGFMEADMMAPRLAQYGAIILLRIDWLSRLNGALLW